MLDGGTLVHAAIVYGQTSVVKWLLHRGHDPNAAADAAYRVSLKVGMVERIGKWGRSWLSPFFVGSLL